jgi:predicted GIY-YIG superfamily endonuclease
MKTYWVYILRCSDGSYYTGMTSNLEQRLSQHNAGTYPGYTKSRRPVRMVFSESFYDIDQAIMREKQIKKWSRMKKEALIDGDYEKLKELARKRWRGENKTSSGQ